MGAKRIYWQTLGYQYGSNIAYLFCQIRMALESKRNFFN